MSDTGPDGFGRFIGGLMIAVGALIALLSGACTLTMGAAILSTAGQAQGVGMGVLVVLVTGGVPFGVGVALMFGGWSIMRPRPKPRADVFDAPPPPPPG